MVQEKINSRRKFYNIDALEKLNIYKDEAKWSKDIRKKAFDLFESSKWPTTRIEEWRRTDISNINFEDYSIQEKKDNPRPEVIQKNEEYSGIIRFIGNNCEGYCLDPNLNKKGVLFKSLDSSNLNDIAEFKKFMKLKQKMNKIELWNASFWSHGYFVYVPEFLEIKKPFLIQFKENLKKAASIPKIFIVLGRGARIKIIEKIESDSDSELIYNSDGNIIIEDSAMLEYNIIQNLGLNTIYFNNTIAELNFDSRIDTQFYFTGSNLSKTRFTVNLNKRGSEAYFNGLYFTDKKQHYDIRTIQRHNGPRTKSNAIIRGAVKDKSRSIYQGLIEVSEDAVKTDAYLGNKNIILNSGAQADAIPSLQIKTNDVKCSHGSTSGKLDEEQLFYLMNRGLDRKEAKILIINGFFESLISKLPESEQSDLQKIIDNKLKNSE